MRDVGDLIPIRNEVRTADGTLTAATVTVAVTKPDGTLVSPALTPTAASTGVYDASFVADQAGVWRWTWTVSGSVVDVARDQVDVATSPPGTYASLSLFKAGLSITSADRDARLQMALTSAARAIDKASGRRPGGFYLDSSATARTYDIAGRTVCAQSGRHRLLVDEIGSTTGLVVETGNGTTWTAVTDYRVEPANALADREPATSLSAWSWGCDQVRVTARWGWPAVPEVIPQAVLIQAGRYYSRKDSPDGTTSGPADFGSVRLARVDPDVREMLGPFTQPGIA